MNSAFRSVYGTNRNSLEARTLPTQAPLRAGYGTGYGFSISLD
jgi:hypothetical protein